MATAALRNSSLCDFCHTKPKYGGHPFCGKTCATQASNLCMNCWQKPKFGTFDFCGKNCATQAQAHPPKPAAKQPALNVAAAILQQTAPLNISKQAGNGAKKPQKVSVQAASSSKQAPARPLQQPSGQNNQAPQLSQWVQVAAAQVPQILSTLNTAQTQPQPHAQVPAPPTNARTHHAPPTKPVATNARSAQQAQVYVDPQSVASPTVLDYPDSPAVCQLPGCEEYAHVDANGDISDYCSRAHREDAVDKGLVDPCIKCLIMPQSKNDYFCGRACREEALHKGSAPMGLSN